MEQGQRGIIWKMNLYDKLRKKRNVALYFAMSMTILLHEIIKYVINNNIEAEIK